MKLTHAMVLAAGLGTRMRPLTETVPKPLIPVKGKPLIDWCIDWLAAAEISTIVINTSYRAEQLENYVKNRKGGPRIKFSREEPAPLETGGGIAKALPLLGNGPFLVMNSDAIIPAQAKHPATLLSQNWSDDLDFLMLLIPKERATGWEGNGDFVMEKGRIRRPNEGEEAPFVFTGVEIIHPRAFAVCPGDAFSVARLWSREADAEGFYSRVRGVVHTGDWLNVSDLDGLKVAEQHL